MCVGEDGKTKIGVLGQKNLLMDTFRTNVEVTFLEWSSGLGGDSDTHIAGHTHT